MHLVPWLQADIVVTFEDTWKLWTQKRSVRDRGADSGGAAGSGFKRAALVHETGELSAAGAQAQLQRARQFGYDYAFFTDGRVPDPWGALPGYWEHEANAVRKLNAHV